MEASGDFSQLERPLDPSLGARLISAARSDRFGAILLEAAHGLAGAEEVFAYRLRPEHPPEILSSCSGLARAEQRTSLYARRFHTLDPASRMASSATGGFAQRIQACQIESADYRATCFDRPGFTEKLCFGWRGCDHTLVMSFYRRRCFPEGSAALAALACLGLSALGTLSPASEGLAARLEARLASAYPELTLRERQVCARSVAGWTSSQIAKALNIKPATALTYRQRAYQRLGYRGAAEFLERLIP